MNGKAGFLLTEKYLCGKSTQAGANPSMTKEAHREVHHDHADS
jgi:hypothetical protein